MNVCKVVTSLALTIHCTFGMQNPAQALKERIDAIITAEKQAQVGVKIVSLKDKSCLYENNSRKLFVPASNVKLFTAAAAFALLGKDYCFETSLIVDGEIVGTTLEGNLYLKCSGDPSLTVQDLEKLVTQLKTKGIKAIRGNLCIDATIFDGIPFGPGWAWDDGSFFL